MTGGQEYFAECGILTTYFAEYSMRKKLAECGILCGMKNAEAAFWSTTNHR